MTKGNGLTPAEAERLAMLAEEASEVAKAAAKILRFGWRGDGTALLSNRTALHNELADLEAVCRLMRAAGDIGQLAPLRIRLAAEKKIANSHHQDPLLTCP